MNSKEPAIFPRAYRLTEAGQYQRVFAGSRRFGNQHITMLVTENAHEYARLGMAISKKCAKRAVDRNRIKRLVRESFRENISTLPSVDIVVLGRPSIIQLNNAILRQQIDKQWHYIRKKLKQSAEKT